MSVAIDTTFDVYSDTREGMDPDSHSPTLRRYHQTLWSKPLPDGSSFELSVDHPKTYLYHKSQRGEFFLSSDSVGHTYRNVKAMAPIISEVPTEELDQFFSVCSTIGGYVVFPSRKIEGKRTINGARGLHWKIKDRFDLTLECIRLHYQGHESPLSADLARYSNFFDLFGSFKGYVDFFLLQDLVSEGGAAIEFFIPFSSFDAAPLPAGLKEYHSYRESVVAFVAARNRRIASQAA